MGYNQIRWIITLVIIIHLKESKEVGERLRSESMLPQKNTQAGDSVQCPMWFIYDNATKQCECYSHNGGIKCGKNKAYLEHNNYLTFSKERGLFLSYCMYFDLSAFKKVQSATEPGFIELPSNLSELNNQICGPANRKGFLCSECADGFGPSATSPKFKCMNCTYAFTRYGITIYLLSEIVPVTAFYFIVLIFQINLTSAPMVSFILYSQVVHNVINYGTINLSDQMSTVLSIVSVFHGIWNLNFFRYVIPPFCVSPKLQIVHIVYLQSISTIFPFILIGITWICIEMHSRNCKILVWIWRTLNHCLIKSMNWARIANTTVIGTFATFFLLSYAKLMFVLAIPIVSVSVYNISDISYTTLKIINKPALDPSEKLFKAFQKPTYIFCLTISALIFLITILLPVLLLALYPIRVFRQMLFKCCSSRCMAYLTVFVEKFYSCYRDGLDGGRDMRSCASIPFFVILLGFLVWSFEASYLLIGIFCICWSLAVTILQPYKHKYMMILDALILANSGFIGAIIENIFDCGSSHLYQTAFKFLVSLPMIFLVCFVTIKVFKTRIIALLNIVREKVPCCNYLLKCAKDNNENNNGEQFQQEENIDELLDADRIVRPEQYMQWGYDSVS